MAQTIGARLSRRIVTFTEDTDGWQRNVETHRQRLFAPAEVEALLDAAALDWTRLDDIGGVPLLPGRIGYIARRAG